MAEQSLVPFDAFLDVLRTKGYGVGLHEYQDLAFLLERWDRTHVGEMGDALAALIGRSESEVRGIRRLFDEVYAPTPTPVTPPPPADPLLFLRRRAWSLSLVAASLVLIAVAIVWYGRAPVAPPVPPIVPAVTVPGPSPVPVAAVTLPPPPAPPLPTEPRRAERRVAIGSLTGLFLVCLAIFWWLKTRDVRRVWLRDAWSAMRATLPGPFHVREVLKGRPTRLPRADVEDAATLLGRVFSRDAQGRTLDVPRTLRETLRRGMLPQLVFKSRRTAQPVVVFQDVSQDMRFWTGKVEGFLADLVRQGVALERWYFDQHLDRVSDRPHRAVTGIESVLRRRPDEPVLVLSSGAGLAAVLEGAPHWPDLFRQRLRKAWLTPVADLRLWPAAFNTVPITVWPMTRTGLAEAARQLATGDEAAASDSVRSRLAVEGRVSLDDVERVKRLASLVPHPSPELLDLLRSRFAPDVSDAAILHLLQQTEGAAAPIIRMSDAEVRRHLNAIRHETPDLEAAARATILEVLLDSEPVPESAAHVRWQIAVNTQRLILGDLRGDARETGTAVQALGELARGPMSDEVREALELAPASPTLAVQTKTVVTEASQIGAPASERQLVAVHRLPWSWPGLREVLPAGVAAALLMLGGLQAGAVPMRTVEHVQDAYDIEYVAETPAVRPALLLRLGPGEAGMPRSVDLYRDQQVVRPGITLGGEPTRVALEPGETGGYYQLRAALPQGNLALSQAVWVPSDDSVFVMVDASPWANVTIEGGTTNTESQPTPFTAALLPGTYQLRYENGGLTPPLATSATVGPDTREIRQQMPGFDPASTADQLVPR